MPCTDELTLNRNTHFYPNFQPTRAVFGNETFGKVTWCWGSSAVPFCSVEVVAVFPPLLLQFLKPVGHVLTSCSLRHKEPERWPDCCVYSEYEFSNPKCNKTTNPNN